MPIPSLFIRRPSSPINIYPNRRDDHPTTPLVITQMPSTPISISSLVWIFFPRIHHSFSVVAEVGKICWVEHGYVMFYLYEPIPDVEILYLMVPDFWIRLGIQDWLSYHHHRRLCLQSYRQESPTPIPSSHSDSALPTRLPTPIPTSNGMCSLRHAISSPFLRPPPFCGSMDME